MILSQVYDVSFREVLGIEGKLTVRLIHSPKVIDRDVGPVVALTHLDK